MLLRTCLAWLILAAPAPAADLTVFAAASLRGAMDDIAAAWASETGGTLTLSFAGSSAIARQVQAGAPADLVILANTAWMDVLEDGGEIDPATRTDLLTNRLVLIGARPEPPVDLGDGAAVLDRIGEARLALALVDAVPAGIYARAGLETLGLWDALQGQVVQSDNVRGALALVATGAAPYGVVYATDAVAEPRVTVLAEFPADTHPAILYPAAALRGADPAALDLLGFLGRPVAGAILSGHGFGLVQP